MKHSKNPSVLAAMAGITTGLFANKCLIVGGAGKVTIGGYPVGREMIRASEEVVRRGRMEFILQNGKEANEISKEAQRVSELSNLIINLRFNKTKDIRQFSNRFSGLLAEKPILELNAHCCQPEYIRRGGGQSLLKRLDIITYSIKVCQSKDFRVSLKIRGNSILPSFLIPKIDHWELDFLHIDSYQIGKDCTDLELLRDYAQRINTPVIGNNSVVDLKSAKAILDTGAQLFSVARAAQKNPLIFKDIMKDF
ncbi:MAG: tRNA-dihydrouridine synthase [Candidatus Hermodarchaeota archaeon]